MDAQGTFSGAIAHRVVSVPYAQTGQFKPAFLAFIERNPLLAGLLPPAPTLAQLEAQASTKAFSLPQRTTLVGALRTQYQAIGCLADAEPYLAKLALPDCFTVTTGHQLSIYLGPLYTVLKALTVIKLAAAYEEAYPHRRCVPIFWLASEDHDIDEIASLRINQKRYHWATSQGGPAGALAPDGLAEILSPLWPELPTYLQHYGSFPTLAQAQQWLLHKLLGQLGLLVLDPQTPVLKASLAPIIARELEAPFTGPAVQLATARLQSAGFEPQIAVRPTNFFLVSEGLRERLVPMGDGTYAAGRLGTFSREELLAILAANPERFSPNVATRPLFQELILPNLAYVGGPAEMVYWLQLTDLFAEAGLTMPVLWPRAHMGVLKAAETETMETLGLSPADLLAPWQALKARLLMLQGASTTATDNLQTAFKAYLAQFSAEILAQDPTLHTYTQAEAKRMWRQAEAGWARLRKAQERRYQSPLDQARTLKDTLCPSGGLQERRESFWTYWLADNNVLAQLLAAVDPTDHAFRIVTLGPGQAL